MTAQKYPSLRELLKRTAGTRRADIAADQLLQKLDERHPDYTAVGVFKAGPYATPLILPIGPSCALKTTAEAAAATVTGNRRLVGYWIRS